MVGGLWLLMSLIVDGASPFLAPFTFINNHHKEIDRDSEITTIKGVTNIVLCMTTRNERPQHHM